jgi:hypothetical protein
MERAVETAIPLDSIPERPGIGWSERPTVLSVNNTLSLAGFCPA